MELVIVLSIALVTPTVIIIVYKYSKDCYNYFNRRTSKFKFKQYAFADPIKAVASILFGFNQEQL